MFHDWFFPGMWFGGIFWIVIIVLIVLVVINQKNRQNSQPPQQESAVDILKKRYARGEISKEEYDKIKSDLEK